MPSKAGSRRGTRRFKAPQTRPAEPGPKAVLGEAAPSFTLKDQNGKAVSLSDYAGKIVVLEWVNPNCPFVQRHYKNKTMESLADKYHDKGVVWLAIDSTSGTDPKIDTDWSAKYNLDYPILNDRAGHVARLYGAKTTPDMFVIDRGGNLVYKGAIDDDPQGEKQHATNYVDAVLSKLIGGQTVALQETKPYGCSVKYAKR